MFCPKCGAEYQPWIMTCAECNVELEMQKPGDEKPEYINLVTVYETGNPAIITIAKSILNSENIHFNMKGDGVQDLFGGGRIGTGFNPLVGPVQVQVDEKDASLARELLSDLEESEDFRSALDHNGDEEIYEEDTPIEPESRSIGRFSLGLLIGIIIAGAGFYYHSYNTKSRSGVIEYDQNNDSKPDLFYRYDEGSLIEINQDRNFDGKIDSLTHFKNDLAIRGESDDNFDAQFETEIFYENGLVDRVEIDTNLNFEPDIIEYYTNEVLDEKVWIHERTNIHWKEVKYEGGIIREERIDNDYDRDFDIKNINNSSGRLIRTEKLK